MIYQSIDKIDRDLKKHELVEIEYGEDIYAVTDVIIRIVNMYLSENLLYVNCEISAYTPDPIEEFRKTK